MMVQSVKSENDDNSFSVSLIAFWIKGSITVDDSFLRVNMPNTILFGLLPAGKNKDTSPLSGITNVYTAKSYKLWSIIFGTTLVLEGLLILYLSFMGALMVILVGAALVGGGIKTAFTYERAGITKIIEFPFFEADRVDELEMQVTQKLAAFQDDRNVRKQTDRTVNQGASNTQQIVDAIQDNGQATMDKNAKFCSNCGDNLQAGAKFCSGCGTETE